MNENPSRFLLAGVGGQGVLLAAGLLSRALLGSGLEVKQAEIHGMSQRGGSVLCSVISGRDVHSPLVDPGDADVLLGFEKLEALRYAHYLTPGGLILSDSRLIPPVGQAPGPVEQAAREGEARLDRAPVQVFFSDFYLEAQRLGNPRLTNTITLGALAGFMGLEMTVWKEAVWSSVPGGTEELNWKAFNCGLALLEK